MNELLFARAQMGLSLAFHILFAAAGVALPLLMVMADLAYRRTRDADYLHLSKKLAKGTAVLFAVGAVSGTVLSFELGLLWPKFMATFGHVIGFPFALEGFAFFTEAIFLGIYLYGRDRVSPNLHLFSGIAVALSGAASAFFVTLVNAFMNLPAGLVVANGQIVSADPVAAMWSAPWATQTAHTLVSCYQATAFAMAGIHALRLLKNPAHAFHRKAFRLALPLACVTALLQTFIGDVSARHVAEHQPQKFAAFEAHFETQRGATLHLGGVVDTAARNTRWAIHIPKGLSWLAFRDTNAEVVGLEAFPEETWPPVGKVHWAFQVMVALGTWMAMLAVGTIAYVVLRRPLTGKPMLWAWATALPMGAIAMEAGWLVTEWGRQPWVVRGFLKTQDALTDVRPLGPPFWVFTLIYVFLGVVVAALLSRQIREVDAHA